MRFNYMLPLRSRCNCQLLVAVVELILQQIELVELPHFMPNGRRSAVRAYHGRILNYSFRARLFVSQLNCAGRQVKSSAALVEMNPHAPCFGCIHQRHIQFRTRNRVDHLGLVFAVALECKFYGERVHHSPAHWDDDIFHGIPEPGFAQRVDAACGHRQIDRSSGADSYPAHIRAPLINLDRKSTLHQRNSKKRARKARTDDRDWHVLDQREGAGSPREDHSSRIDRASQSSGKNFFSSVSFRYELPALPPVPMRAPMVRSTIRMWRSR